MLLFSDQHNICLLCFLLLPLSVCLHFFFSTTPFNRPANRQFPTSWLAHLSSASKMAQFSKSFTKPTGICGQKPIDCVAQSRALQLGQFLRVSSVAGSTAVKLRQKKVHLLQSKGAKLPNVWRNDRKESQQRRCVQSDQTRLISDVLLAVPKKNGERNAYLGNLLN